MKKTIALIILLIAMLIALTGCAEINYEVEVNKDGSGEISYIYGISKEVLTKLNVSADEVVSSMKEQAEESAYTVETYEDENIAGFKANKHIEDLSKDFSLQEAFGEEYVKDTKENGIKIEESLFFTTYSQNAQLDLTTLDEEEQGITMTYQVKLPVKAKTNNASEVLDNGKTLKWNLTGGEINKIEFVAQEVTLKALTSFAETNYQVEINKDGSGDICYSYEISKDVLGKLNITAENLVTSMKEQAEENLYTVEKYEDENIAEFKLNKHIENLDKNFSLQEAFGEQYIKDTENNGIKIEKSLFFTKYSQNAQLDLTTLNEEEQCIYQINLPAKAKTNNASEVLDNGKTLKWNLTGGEINKIEFVAQEINFLPIVIIFVVAFAVVAIVVFIILKKKHVTKNEK